MDGLSGKYIVDLIFQTSVYLTFQTIAYLFFFLPDMVKSPLPDILEFHYLIFFDII